MPQLHWDALASAPAQVLFTLVIFCVVWTLIGMFVMKYFVRQVSILNHAAILFWATFRVQIVAFALVYSASVFGISLRAVSGPLSLVALCTTGWLVTRQLSKDYGVPTKFPAVGAKVIATTVAITWLIVIAIIVITKA